MPKTAPITFAVTPALPSRSNAYSRMVTESRGKRGTAAYQYADEGTSIFPHKQLVQIVNGTTLNANNIDCKEYCVYQTRGILCMPLGWILKLEILDDIVCEKLLIPSEIMLEIELFA